MSHYGRKRISCPGQWKTCLVDEKPTTFFSHLIQDWIEAEKNKPGKRWIFDVITCGREESLELIRTPEFVLLPDGSMLSCVGRDVLNAKGVAQKQISRWTAQSGSLDKDTDQKNRRGSGFGLSADGFVLHLLAIVADCNLRCLWTTIIVNKTQKLEGIYRVGPDGKIARIVDTTTTIPDLFDGPFTYFNKWVCNTPPWVLFIAKAANYFGIFAINWDTQELYLLADSRMTFDGKKIKDAEISNSAKVNNHVALMLMFEDGSSGVYVATFEKGLAMKSSGGPMD